LDAVGRVIRCIKNPPVVNGVITVMNISFFFLLLSLFAGFLLAPFLSLDSVRLAYTISVLFKECLLFLLPLIMFIVVSAALAHFARQSTKAFLYFLGLMMISNAFMIIIALLSAYSVLAFYTPTPPSSLPATSSLITPLSSLSLPNFDIKIAVLLGVFVGLIAGYQRQEAFLLRL
jgi:hypothetical protein